MATDVADIFKAYDIRGVYPEEINPEIAYRIGRALVLALEAREVAVGRDMRVSSPALASAIIDGILDQGADVTDIGLVSTDSLYFAVGFYGYDAGVMVTASHNPAEYNGFKLCREEARPVSIDTGLDKIRDLVQRDRFPEPRSHGTLQQREIIPAFAQHVLSMIDRAAIRPMKIVVDAGNGMAGKIVPAVLGQLPVEVVPLFFELDGRFPNHPANPIEPENVADLRRAILAKQADFGIAFDGDADRMFILDGQGRFVGGDMITALVATALLRKHPGAAVVYNLICSRAVPETIKREGGLAIRARVGHSFIKAVMRDNDAIFGGEHSGHFYFRENWYADSGIIAAVSVIELLSREGISIAEAIQPIDRYVRSGEINSEVRDQQAVMRELERHFADARLDFLDGITIEYPNWWCNVRGSNTQPLLRLNVEADNEQILEEKTREVLSIIRGESQE
ncbi:MAG TPA: phosphomannomutase/phosphoglucomutase [Thermomicrobiaceae bacterium]|nr:phosphomannomutase/phosphoglucomutase [Thermomicrobiaceae bacterium]